MTMFMGMFQILAEPCILAFKDAKTLGIAETICACGMLVSGLILGIKGIKKRYITVLALALAMAGVFMAGFGMFENIFLICAFGFLFFAALPFANNCLDFLVRTNIADEVQGRAWGLIGFLSQMGYVVAYAVSGVAADTIGKVSGLGVGRGAGFVIMFAGACLTISGISVLLVRSIRELAN